MNYAVEKIQDTLNAHFILCQRDNDGGFRYKHDYVMLPPLMVGELEALLDIYHAYKGLCK